jgi:hypothetical protein
MRETATTTKQEKQQFREQMRELELDDVIKGIPEEPLSAVMGNQDYCVWDLVDAWQDRSEAIMFNPQSISADLQEEIFHWIRRFRELLEDAKRIESELAKLRSSIRDLVKEPEPEPPESKLAKLRANILSLAKEPEAELEW